MIRRQWLDRLTYHLLRILYHLQQGQEKVDDFIEEELEITKEKEVYYQ